MVPSHDRRYAVTDPDVGAADGAVVEAVKAVGFEGTILLEKSELVPVARVGQGDGLAVVEPHRIDAMQVAREAFAARPTGVVEPFVHGRGSQ